MGDGSKAREHRGYHAPWFAQGAEAGVVIGAGKVLHREAERRTAAEKPPRVGEVCVGLGVRGRAKLREIRQVVVTPPFADVNHTDAGTEAPQRAG